MDRMVNDVYMILQPTKEQQDARRRVIHFVDTFVKQRIPGMLFHSTEGYSMLMPNCAQVFRFYKNSFYENFLAIFDAQKLPMCL